MGFGSVVALRRAGSNGRNVLWACDYDCGNTLLTNARELFAGECKSCGCQRWTHAAENFHNEGHETNVIDPSYAERSSLIDLVEVAGLVDKIGIAFGLRKRGQESRGNCREVWWHQRMKRAECWAIEQVSLDLTRSFSPDDPITTEGFGALEQRVGWVLADVIVMLEELCSESLAMGWRDFYAKYMSEQDQLQRRTDRILNA